VSLPWDEPGWLDRAIGWIDEQVDRTGEVELERTRPWSAIARVPTADGLIWFKESPPVDAFEPALTELVARARPDATPQIVAWEDSRLLTRHVGPSLREVHDAGNSKPSWEEVLRLYAEVQIELAPLAERALALGTPDERPARLTGLYDELGWPRDLRETVVRAAAALGDAAPLTIVHQEAHDGNVFMADGGRPVFIDWAEATVAHPFVGPLLPLRFAAERAGHEPGSAEVERLRDAYLEPFTPFAPMAELRDAFAHGYQLTPVVRAHLWQRTLEPLPASVAARHGEPVAAWLEILREIADGTIRLGGA
jgi:hypothetical protein